MADGQVPVPGSQKPKEEAVPMIAASGGPLKLSGMAVISLLTGFLSLVAAVIVSLVLGAVMGETAFVPAIIAGLVLGLIAVVCGCLALDSVREVLLPRRDRIVMLAGPVMVGLGLAAIAFTWGTLAAMVIQPKSEDQDQNYIPAVVVTADYPALAPVAPVAAVAPVVPVAPVAPPTGTEGGAVTPTAPAVAGTDGGTVDPTTPATTSTDGTPAAAGTDGATTPPPTMPVPETPASTSTDAATGT